jgi:hypothetical protein
MRAAERTSNNVLEALRNRQKDAANEALEEDDYGLLSGRAHFGFGILGIAGGAFAAASAAADLAWWISGLAGAAAAVGSGAGTFFRFGQRAEWHFRSAAALRSVADLAENSLAGLNSGCVPSEKAPKLLDKVQRRLDTARISAASMSSQVAPADSCSDAGREPESSVGSDADVDGESRDQPCGQPQPEQ